jgi:hypothetical protein
VLVRLLTLIQPFSPRYAYRHPSFIIALFFVSSARRLLTGCNRNNATPTDDITTRDRTDDNSNRHGLGRHDQCGPTDHRCKVPPNIGDKLPRIPSTTVATDACDFSTRNSSPLFGATS